MKYTINPELTVRDYPALRAKAIVAITGKPHLYTRNGRLVASGRDKVCPARFKAAVRYIIRVS